mmetsp:Transcript_65468/g.140057  ORF Transcript_65468/g.140057 Transcript_65468/m.140057 type:complete len:228 (+) Transcript_65468:877-1560(+)
MQVSDNCDLLALGNANPSQGLPLDQDVEQVDGHPVGILHRQQLTLLVALQGLPDPGLVDRRGAVVARTGITCRLRQGCHIAAEALYRRARVARGSLGNLVFFDHGVRWQVLVARVRAVDRRAWVGNANLFTGILLQLHKIHGDRELDRLHAHRPFRFMLKLPRRTVQDLVVEEVHDVQEIPSADLLIVYRLDDVAIFQAVYESLALRIPGVARLVPHLPDHRAFAIG